MNSSAHLVFALFLNRIDSSNNHFLLCGSDNHQRAQFSFKYLLMQLFFLT